MNLDAYNTLPDDLKAVIDDNSGIGFAALFGQQHDSGDIAGKAMTEAAADNVIATISGEEQARFEAAAATVNKAWIASNPGNQALFDAANALVAEETRNLANK